jgi:hypothetical protein
MLVERCASAALKVEWWNEDDGDHSVVYDASGTDQRTNALLYQLVIDVPNDTEAAFMITNHYWRVGTNEDPDTASYGSGDDVATLLRGGHAGRHGKLASRTHRHGAMSRD